MNKTRRRNSEVTFREYFYLPVIKGLSKTEMNYAYGVVIKKQDLIKHKPCSVLLAKNLIFKEFGKEVTHQILRDGVLRPLHSLPCLYVESPPEVEYERRLMSLVLFMKEYGTKMTHRVYMKIFERIIEDFRPALFIELYQPNLKDPINEYFLFRLIEFMKTEFCHLNLLYGTVDMKKMIDEDISEERIAEKLRKLYIPILGLLNAAGTNEPEVIKEIKIILND